MHMIPDMQLVYRNTETRSPEEVTMDLPVSVYLNLLYNPRNKDVDILNVIKTE